MFGNLDSEDIYDLVMDLCDFIIGFKGEIPGQHRNSVEIIRNRILIWRNIISENTGTA